MLCGAWNESTRIPVLFQFLIFLSICALVVSPQTLHLQRYWTGSSSHFRMAHFGHLCACLIAVSLDFADLEFGPSNALFAFAVFSGWLSMLQFLRGFRLTGALVVLLESKKNECALQCLFPKCTDHIQCRQRRWILTESD